MLQQLRVNPGDPSVSSFAKGRLNGGPENYRHVAHLVFNEPWALKPEMYATICDLVRFRVNGGHYTAEEIQERIGAGPGRARPVGGGGNGAVAVRPLYGIIGQRMNLMMEISGGVSTEMFGQQFQADIADPSIRAVVIDIDSPGGSVFGVAELWQTIMDARGSKPIVAVANSMAASAAYWIASAADEIVVTPGGEIGSIGVYAAHEDLSGAQEREGIKTTLISVGKKKVLGNPFEPLSDEARASIQEKVDAYGAMFVNAVARGRNVKASEVVNGFGEGDTVLANEAVKLNMADRVGTLDGTIQRLLGKSGGRGRKGGQRPSAEAPAGGNSDLNRRRVALL